MKRVQIKTGSLVEEIEPGITTFPRRLWLKLEEGVFHEWNDGAPRSSRAWYLGKGTGRGNNSVGTVFYLGEHRLDNRVFE